MDPFLLFTYSLGSFKHSLGFNYRLCWWPSNSSLSYVSDTYMCLPTRCSTWRSPRELHWNMTRMNPRFLRCILGFSSFSIACLKERCYCPCSNQKWGFILASSTLCPHPTSNPQVLKYSSKHSITPHLHWPFSSFGKH